MRNFKTAKENTGYVCLVVVLKMLGIEFPETYVDRFSGPIDTHVNIVRTARDLSVKVKTGEINVSKLNAVRQPMIAETNSGDYLIVLKKVNSFYFILDPSKGKPEQISREQLINILSGRIIVLGKKGDISEGYNNKFGFGFFITYILKFWKQFACVLFAVFVIQILEILTPLMTQVVVDKVLSHHALNTLHTIAVGIIIVYIYELIISLCKSYLFVHTTNRIDVILGSKVFKHLFGLPLKYFESRRVGETIARVKELDQIRSFLTGTPLSSMIDLLFITVYIVVLFFYSVPLSIIVLISLPLFAILSIIITPLFKKSLDKKFETGARSQSFLVEAINGIHTVKSFALEEKFEDKWGDLQSDYVRAGYKTSIIAQTSNNVASFIQHITDVLILVVGAEAVINGSISIGQLVAFRMLAGRVSGPVLRLVSLWQEYQQAKLSVERIGDIFTHPMERKETVAKKSVPIVGAISFNNVRFRYRADGSDVLHGISFNIEAGKIVGLVGRSGSGKSTISKLIQKLYIPQNGRITIDGNDIALMDPTVLRRNIGMVLQENFMFNGTVAENIAIHCDTVDMDRVIDAAKIAGAHDFINELDEGYDTVIGEKGVALSGGQKQRVAIARAIINDPKILIFDEATSALDYESESIIQNNLKEICKNRTVLIIAHRLSTLSNADEIMVIDKGELIEKGCHEELMSMQGLYAYLYNKQNRGEIE